MQNVLHLIKQNALVKLRHAQIWCMTRNCKLNSKVNCMSIRSMQHQCWIRSVLSLRGSLELTLRLRLPVKELPQGEVPRPFRTGNWRKVLFRYRTKGHYLELKVAQCYELIIRNASTKTRQDHRITLRRRAQTQAHTLFQCFCERASMLCRSKPSGSPMHGNALPCL